MIYIRRNIWLATLLTGMMLLTGLQARAEVFTPNAEVAEFRARIGLEHGDTVAMVPEGVTALPAYAFMACSDLREVRLPASLRRIGEGAFRECKSLTRMVLPDSVEDIGSFAFIYCTDLQEVVIPESVRHIGHNAFSRCESLRAVSLPREMTELESYAFSDCTSLQEVRLPKCERVLGELIFSGCSALRRLEVVAETPQEFDCGSSLFDDGDAVYDRCRLVVPSPAARKLYRRANEWRKLIRN